MITKEGLEALARYAPILEAKGFAWSDWHAPTGQVPWLEHGDVASAFVEDAYRFGWVSSDFDWPEWSRTDEARRLREDPDEVAAADAPRLVKLLTCAIRSDRFCEGALAGDYDSGPLARIAARARALAASAFWRCAIPTASRSESPQTLPRPPDYCGPRDAVGRSAL